MLAGTMDKVICLDGDSLWYPQIFNIENTVQFYDLWFKLANDITDNGVSVALFRAGLGLSENLTSFARDTFDVHFLSLYCSNEELESRLLSRPEWKNAGEGAIGFINVMKGMNMKYQHLFIESKIDTSDISLNESVSKVNEWIMSCM